MSTVDTLRPSGFDEFIGQPMLKARLMTHIRSAAVREKPLDHILLIGPPGFGKTTIAEVIASEIGDPFERVSMGKLTATKLVRLVRRFRGVLFIDEIHQGSDRGREELYDLLEFGHITTPNGERYHPAWLTIIAATTEREKLKPALTRRFPTRPELEEYTDPQMGRIVESMALKAGVVLSIATCRALGVATGGVPGAGRELVLAARDLAIDGKPVTAERVLRFCRIDPDGLTVEHGNYLRALSVLGGTAGLNSIASMLGVNEQSAQALERLLLNRGFITRTKEGRELLGIGYDRVEEKARNR